MIRSLFPLKKIFLLPFGTLLVIYLLVVGGGGLWLLAELRQAESRLLIDRLLSELKPVASELSQAETLTQIEESDSPLNNLVERLFVRLPGLREVTIRDTRSGYVMSSPDGRNPVTYPTGPLTEETNLDEGNPDVGLLHGDGQELFLIRYSLLSPARTPAQLEFGFNRAELQYIVQSAMSSLKHSILLFSIIGAASILIAFGIAIYAGRQVRRLESYHQEIYRRAHLTELGASLVHELRNPLAAIRSNIRALLVTPEETPEIVEELDRELMFLSEKLSGFLSLTRESQEQFKTVDLRTVLQDSTRLADPVVKEKGLHIRTEIEDDLPALEAQENHLRDALVNLLINAANSGQKEGDIFIRARGVADSIVIEVDDRGPGIPPEALPKIFEPFYTTRADGSGLGLAIVKRIIDNHHGTIRAENRDEGGACFSITLPLQQVTIPKWWKTLKVPSRI